MDIELYDNELEIVEKENDTINFTSVCVQNELTVEVANTDVIYQAAKSFVDMGLDETLIKSLRDFGILSPSLIQANIFPYVFSDNPRNIIAQSQSGTGKTLSYILVALQVVDYNNDQTQILIITPTIELSYQVHEKLTLIGNCFSGLKIDLAVKENSPKYGKSAQIIVGCVGTILRWILTPNITNLDACRFIMVDEADSVILQKHQLKQLRIVKSKIPNHCLHIFCSATFDQRTFRIARKMMYDPMCIRLRQEELSLDNIHQYFSVSQNDQQKVKMVCKIINIPGVTKSFIFCNRREDACRICKSLATNSVYALTITGDLKPNERTETFNRFRNGLDYAVLICTDVCSRGIDIKTVNTVINYHIPRGRNNKPDFESYYHRIGRGGRFGRKSISFTLISEKDDFYFIECIEKYFKIKIPEIKILEDSFESDIKSLTETSNRSHLEQINKIIVPYE